MKTYKTVPLTDEELQWYSGKSGIDATMVKVNPPWFPTELFCDVRKGGWFDMGKGAKEYGIIEGFCGSAGMIFKKEFIQKVLSVLEKNGYKQKGE